MVCFKVLRKCGLIFALLIATVWPARVAIGDEETVDRSVDILEEIVREANLDSGLERGTPVEIQESPLYSDPAFTEALEATVANDLGPNLGVSARAANARIYFGVSAPQLTSVVELHSTHSEQVPEFKCTGVLIGSRLILTAAHCLCSNHVDGLPITYARFEGVSDTGTALGESRAIDSERKAAMPARASDPDGLSFCKLAEKKYIRRGDIALVGLKNDAPPFARTASVASEIEIQGRTSGLVVGYGLTQNREAAEHRLAARAIIATHDCTGKVSVGERLRSRAYYYGCNEGSEMIASGHGTDQNRQDACDGDSGGPLFAATPPLTASIEQSVMAIVSRAIENPKTGERMSCGSGTIYVPLTGDIRTWVCNSLDEFGQSGQFAKGQFGC